MAAVHRQAYVCRKADQVIHPDRETPRQILERHWWEMRGLVEARRLLADQCPQLASGRDLPMRLAIRENEFTVNHRPLHLRILLAACDTCPDPHPLEPIMPADREEAEVVHAAALNTLGRLRYYAQHDSHLRGLMEEFDGAVATGLGITPADVPARTGTEPLPSDRDREFERLLGESSLGAPHARAARDSVLDEALVRRLVDRTLADLHDDDRGLNGAVEMLAALPGHFLRQVRLALVDLAEATHRAQARRDGTDLIHADEESAR